MFYAIIPTAPPMFAVQPDGPLQPGAAAAELLGKLERHFMLPVVLVSWNGMAAFESYGPDIPEGLVTAEDLVWRKFELPVEPEIPF